MSVKFLPSGKVQEAAAGENLLTVAAKGGTLLNASCGGRGTCGKCKVKILSGDAGAVDDIEREHFSEEEIRGGWRLACKVSVTGDLTVEVPEKHGGSSRKKDLLWMPDGFTPDRTEAARRGESAYGLAVDVGTTTVVGILWDLAEGKQVEALARTNPQSGFGADVISRIQFCGQKSENLSLMRNKILECFHDILDGFEKETGVTAAQVKQAVIVGNTTMSHLFLGINPASLALSPFAPAFRGPVTMTAAEFGLEIDPAGMIYVLPNIAGHVGSDITAVLLASGLKEMEGANLAIDIGTNGEILLAHKGRVLTCSTAAGPAFEGASIHQGMRASKGAIESVSIEEGQVTLSVIGGGEPAGICGSGLIDCVAAMLDQGIVTKKGKIISREEAETAGFPANICQRLSRNENGMEFLLYENRKGIKVAITQLDIREVQLAKGAIYAGITLLLKGLGIAAGDISRILLAGAFGNYINKKSAMTIGLIPDISLEKVVSIGNAAGVGACMALLSASARELSYSLAEDTEHVELADDPEFQDIFLRSMYF